MQGRVCARVTTLIPQLTSLRLSVNVQSYVFLVTADNPSKLTNVQLCTSEMIFGQDLNIGFHQTPTLFRTGFLSYSSRH